MALFSVIFWRLPRPALPHRARDTGYWTRKMLILLIISGISRLAKRSPPRSVPKTPRYLGCSRRSRFGFRCSFVMSPYLS